MTAKQWAARVEYTLSYTAPELWDARVEQLVDEYRNVTDNFLSAEQARNIVRVHIDTERRRLSSEVKKARIVSGVHAGTVGRVVETGKSGDLLVDLRPGARAWLFAYQCETV
jgi:hypothetical protein